MSSLHEAAKNGNLDETKRLLENGANIEAKSGIDNTPLHVASLKGHLELVKLLLENGANIEDEGFSMYTPLQYASENGHLEVVKLLLEKGANIESKDESNFTPLQTALGNGHLEVVKLLLGNGANIEAKRMDGKTPLNKASEYGELEVVELLLENGANIESRDMRDRTPLHNASSTGHIEVVKLLLKNGANIEATSMNGSVLNTTSSLEIMKLLIKEGANVNAIVMKNRRTVLHFSSIRDELEVIELLLENGANIEAKDIYGKTAKDLATNSEVIKLFELYESNNIYNQCKIDLDSERETITELKSRIRELEESESSCRVELASCVSSRDNCQILLSTAKERLESSESKNSELEKEVEDLSVRFINDVDALETVMDASEKRLRSALEDAASKDNTVQLGSLINDMTIFMNSGEMNEYQLIVMDSIMESNIKQAVSSEIVQVLRNIFEKTKSSVKDSDSLDSILKEIESKDLKVGRMTKFKSVFKLF